jgi:hypothetical protein
MAEDELHYLDFSVGENIPNPTAKKYGEPPLFIDPDSVVADANPICRWDQYFIVRDDYVF